MRYFTLHYTTPDYTTLDYTTAHYTTAHCTTFITPHHNYNCNYTTLVALHTTTTPLHYNYNYTTTTTTAALRHTTSSSCGHNQCNHSKKTQLQPPFGPSVDSLCHFSYSVLSLKLPPPPCAVLLNKIQIYSKFVTSPPESGRDAAAWLVRKSRKGAGAKELLRWP